MSADFFRKSNSGDTAVGHRNWLLTFGDLLTLLLCFFIAMVSFSDLNTSPQKKEYQAKSVDYKAATQPEMNSGRLSSNGTTLALNEVRQESKSASDSFEEYWFVEKDFSNLVTDIDPRSAEELKRRVTRLDYRAKQIEVQTCDAKNQLHDGTSNEVAVLRALALRRQVIDALPSFNAEAVRIKVLENGCEEFETNKNESRTALVRVFWDIANG